MNRDLRSLGEDLVWWGPPAAWMILIMWLSTDAFSAANTALLNAAMSTGPMNGSFRS